eukprot:TRINITY_DN202_c0_g1_i1.p3 TRINITY_DN202_c0_g1~~TRINITY_DN202_c0_g1_i1.p3  ORF type:complete len:114 (+),score=29.58 TRINITY_DN202_c0_g1_i1:432-773(+)
MRKGKYKVHFEITTAKRCHNQTVIDESFFDIPEERSVNIPLIEPIIFDLDEDPGESTTLTLPQVLADCREALQDKLGDIQSTTRTVADFSAGDKTKAPCCKGGTVENFCKCNA